MKTKNKKPTPKRNRLPAMTIAAIITMMAIALILATTAATHRVQSSAQPTQGMAAAVGAVETIPPARSTSIMPAVNITPQAEPTLDMGNCPSNWAASPNQSIRDNCAKLKEVNSQKQRAAEIATMQTAPYSPSIPNFRPVTLLPPPDYATTVKERVFDPYKGPPPFEWRDATSVWQAGAIPNKDYTWWSALYIWSTPGTDDQYGQLNTGSATNTYPILKTELIDSLSDGNNAKYTKKWVCPHALGEIQITNVTIPSLNIPNAQTPFPGLQGIVYFKAKNGQTGNFNLARETWTFDTPTKTP